MYISIHRWHTSSLDKPRITVWGHEWNTVNVFNITRSNMYFFFLTIAFSEYMPFRTGLPLLKWPLRLGYSLIAISGKTFARRKAFSSQFIGNLRISFIMNVMKHIHMIQKCSLPTPRSHSTLQCKSKRSRTGLLSCCSTCHTFCPLNY